jgi:hypothetical protein
MDPIIPAIQPKLSEPLIQESTRKTDSAPFIAFMLRMILDTVTSSTPEVKQEVTPEVRLLSVLVG